MSSDTPNKSPSDPGGAAAMVLVGIVLFFLALPPLLVGIGLFLVLRDRLGRKERWALLGVTTVAVLALAEPVAVSYANWVTVTGNTVFSAGTWGEVLGATPWGTLLLLGAVLAAALLLLVETKLGTRFGKVLPRKHAVHTGKGLFGRGGDVDEDALLDANTRRELLSKANVVTPPGGGLTPDLNAHSILDPQEPGKRKFPIGVDIHGSPLYLGEDEIKTHGVILGATGSGKTETIKALVGCLLDLGWSGLILDLKEDTSAGGLRDWCQTYSNTHGTPYQELRLSDPDSPTWFNSLQGMGPDEMRDAILVLQHFEAAYYEALNKELLGQLVNLMYWAHEADPDRFDFPTMYDLAKICGSGKLSKSTQAMRAVVQQMIPGVSEADFRVLTSPSTSQQDAAVGFGARLGNVFDTQAGRAVLRNNAAGTRVEIDVTKEGLTYIGLDSLGKEDLTRVVSSAMLQRLSVYASARTTGQAAKTRPRFVVVDEANWVNRGIVQNMLSRARSAGISMFLCTQGPRDWIDQDGDDWATLTQNVNVALFMRQGEPESALLCAEYFGKKKRTRMSESITEADSLFGPKRVRDHDGRLINRYNVSEDLDYRVPPDTFRELTVGQLYLRVGSPEQRVEFVRVIPRDPTKSPTR